MLKKCEYCGKEFEAKRATARFDTDTCRKAYARKVEVAPKNMLAASSAYAPDLTEAERIGGVQSAYIEPKASMKDIAEGTPSGQKAVKTAVAKSSKAQEKKLAEANAPSKVLTRDELRALPGPERKAYLIKELNERLAAKGLPLLSDKPDPVQFIPTGIGAIDGLTANGDEDGIGGIPRRHITEIFGPKGTGKSSLMRFIANNLEDLQVLYVDAENGLIDPPEHIIISKATDLSVVDDMVYQAVESGRYDVVIVDSVAALTTRKETEEGKDTMGGKAKMMAAFIRRVSSALRPIGPDGYPDTSPGTAVIFINQLRDTMNSFGVQEYTPGGRSIEYAASLRLELRSAKADRVLKDGVAIGQKVRVKVEKSRFGAPGITSAYKMLYKDLG